MQKQQAKATWNPKADRWEESTQDIYGHSDAYVETWPKSGMTRDGQLFELPILVPPITGRECSSSQPPQPPNERYLPTPNARDDGGGGAQHPDIRRAGGHQVCLTDVAVELGELTYLPTPTTMDTLPVREGEAREKCLHRGDLNGSRRRFMGNLREDIVYETDGNNFGVYSAAVKRWEATTRSAPAPTEPGRTGKPRLAAPFSEWVMGLPEGWITSEEIGLTRNQQLRAAGNGVVPQQAEAALRMLIGETAGQGRDVTK